MANTTRVTISAERPFSFVLTTDTASLSVSSRCVLTAASFRRRDPGVLWASAGSILESIRRRSNGCQEGNTAEPAQHLIAFDQAYAGMRFSQRPCRFEVGRCTTASMDVSRAYILTHWRGSWLSQSWHINICACIEMESWFCSPSMSWVDLDSSAYETSRLRTDVCLIIR